LCPGQNSTLYYNRLADYWRADGSYFASGPCHHAGGLPLLPPKTKNNAVQKASAGAFDTVIFSPPVGGI